jgi:hypothetical protein
VERGCILGESFDGVGEIKRDFFYSLKNISDFSQFSLLVFLK